MLLTPAAPFMAQETNLTAPASNFGTLVTASATPHSKNTTYTQLIASTGFDAYGILILFGDVGGVNATDTAMLVDIAIGAAAAESVIIPNLNAGMAYRVGVQGAYGGQKYWFPLYIPSGSRLSATCQAAVISDNVRVSVWLFGKPLRPVWAGQKVTDYGTNLATSRGVTVALGTSAAEGAWTQITAAATYAHPYLALGVGGAGQTTQIFGNVFMDMGVGAATESPLVENMPIQISTAEEIGYYFPISSWAQTASGVRLVARGSYASASAQNLDCIIYGVS